jgi:hypothetical protein
MRLSERRSKECVCTKAVPGGGAVGVCKHAQKKGHMYAQAQGQTGRHACAAMRSGQARHASWPIVRATCTLHVGCVMLHVALRKGPTCIVAVESDSALSVLANAIGAPIGTDSTVHIVGRAVPTYDGNGAQQSVDHVQRAACSVQRAACSVQRSASACACVAQGAVDT